MVITIFSYAGLTLMNLRFLIATNFKPISELFANTNFREFFANSNCWFSAAQETFLTWGLLGEFIHRNVVVVFTPNSEKILFKQ